jgi:hypothetical protein
MSKPSSNEKMSHVAASGESRDLVAQTLRTMTVLVGSCVLFVGVLSVSAVVITNKAMGNSAQETSAGAAETEGSSKSAAPKKPALSPAPGDVGSHPI